MAEVGNADELLEVLRDVVAAYKKSDCLVQILQRAKRLVEAAKRG